MSLISEEEISRLAKIKGVYEKASLLLDNATPLDGAISLVLMDNILESLFKLTLDKIETKEKREKKQQITFPFLLNTMTEKITLLKNHELSLNAMHIARNSFQHHGIIPDLGVVTREYKTLVDTVLRIICENQFKRKWEDVSLSLLIKDANIQRLFKKSEESASRKDYVTASSYLIYIFESTKLKVQGSIFGSGLSLVRMDIKNRYKLDDSVIKYLTTIDEELEIFKLGLDYAFIRNYLDIAGYVGITSILGNITMGTEEVTIPVFKTKLSTVNSDILVKWYISTKDLILKFVLREESNPRISLLLLSDALSGFSDLFKNVK